MVHLLFKRSSEGWKYPLFGKFSFNLETIWPRLSRFIKLLTPLPPGLSWLNCELNPESETGDSNFIGAPFLLSLGEEYEEEEEVVAIRFDVEERSGDIILYSTQKKTNNKKRRKEGDLKIKLPIHVFYFHFSHHNYFFDEFFAINKHMSKDKL